MLDLDETDRALLSELQRDAGRSVSELAAAVGLSQSPVWRRLKRLEAAGVVQKTVALIDSAAVGKKLVAVAMVSLSEHRPESVAVFEAALHGAPEVQEAYAVTGDRDFILRVLVEDVEAYQRFLTERLLPLTMIRSINTSFALRRVKFTTAVPVE